ncbi:zinc finger CCCH domain-containing protein 11A-like [Centrocercus urophasianus]|uniref:zinc finger CCCH domain-containing protein 11A-like n=1 Tax=Centrocercus urophasianus TaxID=9002 RepID=UPI001C652E29|nr:zinc finger CCCH domain-containing protein 11A-like [Centrocercus urophasianus]
MLNSQKQRSAVPCARKQQPAGCQKSNSALQCTGGRDGDRPSLAPRKRTEPAHPWDGAGHGGKRKASPEADTSSLPLKHCSVERHRRSMECGTAPKRARGAESNGERRMNAVQEVYSERAHLRTESKLMYGLEGFLTEQVPVKGEDHPLQ